MYSDMKKHIHKEGEYDLIIPSLTRIDNRDFPPCLLLKMQEPARLKVVKELLLFVYVFQKLNQIITV